MTNNANPPELPTEVVEEINKQDEVYADVQWGSKAKFISHPQSDNWDQAYEDYKAGATSYATKLHEERQQRVHLEKENDILTANYNQLKKEFDSEMQKNYESIVSERAALNDAKALLEELRTKHESGLLPDRFIYEKIKTFLYGE